MFQSAEYRDAGGKRGYRLQWFARRSGQGQSYRLLLFFGEMLVLSRQYEYHQRQQAERERDALVALGHLEQVSGE